MEKKAGQKRNCFEGARYDIEHAFSMYALDYCTIPAKAIYEKEALASMMDVISKCHIYLIGYTPIICFSGAMQRGEKLCLTFEIAGKKTDLYFDVAGLTLINGEDGSLFLEDDKGERFWVSEEAIQVRLAHETRAVKFMVKYIGQAYGKDGSRNAIDRLLKHETLQKISLKGVPEGYQLTLLMLSIEPSNQLVTLINPFAKSGDSGNSRITQGLEKARNTNEAEKVSLYEAALIRYFYPEYNKEFKDSFPSTNLKILQDCYHKDFSALIAEIFIDDLPFMLCSEKVEAKFHHIARHHLHNEDDRKVFFAM